MALKHWLVKSEPSVYSYDQLAADGCTVWDGVRNYAARIHLNGMQKNDLVLYYHSMDATEVVGIAKVVRTAFPDPTDNEGKWVAVELTSHKKLKNSVPLSKIKAEKKLQNIALVRIGRLSVMPLAKDEFDCIVNMGA
ncbi:MAG: EVE domain-containing protein [Bacteroidetes bacterium]|nr:EVE domain-containing protein [Bacteroidota bacterium]